MVLAHNFTGMVVSSSSSTFSKGHMCTRYISLLPTYDPWPYRQSGVGSQTGPAQYPFCYGKATLGHSPFVIDKSLSQVRLLVLVVSHLAYIAYLIKGISFATVNTMLLP